MSSFSADCGTGPVAILLVVLSVAGCTQLTSPQHAIDAAADDTRVDADVYEPLSDPCGVYGNCRECLTEIGCGWCTSTWSCQSGTRRAVPGSCPLGGWAAVNCSQDCACDQTAQCDAPCGCDRDCSPRPCSAITNCEQCTSPEQADCSWCDTGNCMNVRHPTECAGRSRPWCIQPGCACEIEPGFCAVGCECDPDCRRNGADCSGGDGASCEADGDFGSTCCQPGFVCACPPGLSECAQRQCYRDVLTECSSNEQCFSKRCDNFCQTPSL